MARTTKLELQQALNNLGEELKLLRAEVSALRADNARLTTENAALRDQLMDAASVMQTGNEQELADAAQAVSRAAAAPATNPVANIRGRHTKTSGFALLGSHLPQCRQRESWRCVLGVSCAWDDVQIRGACTSQRAHLSASAGR